MQDDAVERRPELGDAVLGGCGGQLLVEPAELTEDPCGTSLGGDAHGLPTDSGSQGHVACACMGTGSASEVNTTVPTICGRKHCDSGVEVRRSLLIVAKCSQRAGSGGADVRRVEPGPPDTVGTRAIEEGERGVVSPVSFSAFTEYGMRMSTVQNGDDFETATGAGGAPSGGGEAEGVGRVSGVDRELGLSAEDVRGEITVASDKGSVKCLRGMTVSCALITDVLGEPPRQLFVARLQGKELNCVVTTSVSASYPKREKVLLQRGQHVPGADEVVSLNHHSAELREVLERRAHVGEFCSCRHRRRDGCRSQTGEPRGENDAARHGHEKDPSVDSSRDDDRFRVVSKRDCLPGRASGQGHQVAGPMAPCIGPVIRRHGSGHQDRAVLRSVTLRLVPAANQCASGIKSLIKGDSRLPRNRTFSALETPKV